MGNRLRNYRGSSDYMAEEGASIVLEEGELFIEYQPIGGPKLKVGNGSTVYSLLPYIQSEDSSKSKMSKKRYVINVDNWSTSANSDGYYTYTVTLSNPTLNTNYAPNVYIAGADDNTFPTDAEKTAYSLLEQCNLTSTNSIILYTKTKPVTTFYVFIEGEAVL